VTAIDDLVFYNGIGGFNAGNEYELRLSGEDLPPAPWINVIANESGGFIVSEAGSGPVWAINSSQFRLTPWQNDPVCDRPGDCIYLRDDATGDVWTPTPAPIRESTPYSIKHGAGYSVFDHEHDGIRTSLRMGAPVNDPVKLQELLVTNTGSRRRSVTIASYAEWVLGTDRERTRFQVRSWHDSGVLLAQNEFNPEFAHMAAFAAMSAPVSGWTRSRAAFFGRNGSLSRPRFSSSDIEGSDADSCAVLETRIELAPGESRRITIAIGAAAGAERALVSAKRYRDPAVVTSAIDAAVNGWRSRLGSLTVQTPEPSFDLMLNQWAFYQALSCRVWGRIALYQSSGAYGFRDQLQDVMAFTCVSPELTREQIVRSASRQFEEGDVQHWWHPHSGRGIRTRFSDDLVWLPFVVDHYLRVTGDDSILDVETHYLRMRGLEPDEEEIYAVPEVSDRANSVFGHCIHALERACTRGEHGLPLIGSGDWNDGMNRVGVRGKGESVWLAWFLIDTCRKFAVHAERIGQHAAAAWLRSQADDYVQAVERSAWDGEWYRRAYYDDGSPLGSHVNNECQIDSIAQSWSVISGAGDPERTRIAMDSLRRRLVDEDARLIMLLTPPFDRGTHDPGYIQGYLPGVRENGAQYTHAALWAVLATALQGNGDRALELYQMINPITHASTPDDVAMYKVEPYVVAADVYTAESHVGRGGWTWYTGSASWLYLVGLEAILGFRKAGDMLEMNPCIPSSWKEFSIGYRHGDSLYEIRVLNPSGICRGVASTKIDGAEAHRLKLVDDGGRHSVEITMGDS
jgi:cyclic beta-1,2-glucan synthetase